MTPRYERTLIVSAVEGLGASLARVLHAAGLRIGLTARNTEKLAALAGSLVAAAHPCDVSHPEQVDAGAARKEPVSRFALFPSALSGACA